MSLKASMFYLKFKIYKSFCGSKGEHVLAKNKKYTSLFVSLKASMF